MDLTPPSTSKRPRLEEKEDSSKRQRVDTTPEGPAQKATRKRLRMEVLEELVNFVTDSELGREQGENMQTLVQKVTAIASNVYIMGKECDEGFSLEALELLQEAANTPLRCKKQTPPPKTTPKPSQKSKPAKPKEPDASPTQRITRQRRHDNHTMEQDADAAPSTPSRVSLTDNVLHVTPSKEGNNWRATWVAISKDLTPSTKTMIGNVLNRVFSLQGVHDALEMAEQIEQNREVVEIDAASISATKLGSLTSPARSAALRWKVMMENSLPKEIRGARQLDNARRLAQEIETLEHQASSSETPIGALYKADRERERRRRDTAGTASAFVMDHLVQITFPPGATAELTARRHKRLTKDRMIARNVDSMVEIFGIGVIPLMCGSSWQSAFASFSVETMKPLLLQLRSQEPALFAVTEGVRESFFRFVQDRRSLEDLPESAMKGMGMKKAEREKLTMLELVLPQPGTISTVPVVFRRAHPRDRFLQAAEDENMAGEDGSSIGDEDNAMAGGEEVGAAAVLAMLE